MCYLSMVDTQVQVLSRQLGVVLAPTRSYHLPVCGSSTHQTHRRHIGGTQ